MAATPDLNSFPAEFGADLRTFHRSIPTLTERPLLDMRSAEGWITAIGLNLAPGGLTDQVEALSRLSSTAVMASWQAGFNSTLFWHARDGQLLA